MRPAVSAAIAKDLLYALVTGMLKSIVSIPWECEPVLLLFPLAAAATNRAEAGSLQEAPPLLVSAVADITPGTGD